MALVLADRVQETSPTSGTGTLTLSGAALGYATFSSAVGNGNTTYYVAYDPITYVWEIGVGTVGAGTLSRDTVFSNSSGTTAKISFTGNQLNVWCDYPASRAVYEQDDGSVVLDVASSSAALRITQTGAGNALLVEDSANPDSTPFVITSTGDVGIGTLSPTNGVSLERDGATQFNFVRNSDNAAPPYFVSIKRRGTNASKVIVNNNDQALSIQAYAYDGTSDNALASIEAFVDGTPGTNDMPGRLVFSTTADGASSPTEQMRIDSTGQIIQGTPTGAVNGSLQIRRNTTGGTTAYTVGISTTVQSDVTSQASGYSTFVNTAATAFTLNLLKHYNAQQGTIGAGSTLNSQYGFFADSTLTGATNNFGFYSNIASGTGRWNFYAAGTAANYFAGAVTIDGTATLATGAVLNTPASGTLSNCTVDGTNKVGYLNIPQNAQAGNYTLVAGDSGKHIYHAVGAGAATYTIPANGSVAYGIGTAITFVNMSTTSISIAITTDTMYLAGAGTTGTRTLAQYGTATALKLTSTTWVISGAGLS